MGVQKPTLRILLILGIWNVVIFSPELASCLRLGEKCGIVEFEGTGKGNFTTTTLYPPKTLEECSSEDHLECIEGRCSCVSGYTVGRNGSCLEVATRGLMSPCEENIQCWKGLMGRLSECNSTVEKCQCYHSETIPIVFHQGR